MKRNAKSAAERLKNVILSDKLSHSERLNELLCADVTELLNNYFELYPSSVVVRLADGNQSLEIMIDARAQRVKPYGNFTVE